MVLVRCRLRPKLNGSRRRGGWPELRIGSEESPEYALTMPRRIVMDRDGPMLVSTGNRISVFDATGQFVRYIGLTRIVCRTGVP
jgi:hypothetical protein